jgi:hypothetical protein
VGNLETDNYLEHSTPGDSEDVKEGFGKGICIGASVGEPGVGAPISGNLRDR